MMFVQNWIVKDSNGLTVHTYQCDSGPIADQFNTSDFSHELQPEIPLSVYDGRRILTKLEFLQLFTIQERIGIKTSTDLVVQDLWNLLSLSGEINLDFETTVQGLGYLQAVGLLSEERKTTIFRG